MSKTVSLLCLPLCSYHFPSILLLAIKIYSFFIFFFRPFQQQQQPTQPKCLQNTVRIRWNRAAYQIEIEASSGFERMQVMAFFISPMMTTLTTSTYLMRWGLLLHIYLNVIIVFIGYHGKKHSANYWKALTCNFIKRHVYLSNVIEYSVNVWVQENVKGRSNIRIQKKAEKLEKP